MGAALPMAIGAALASSGPVVAFVGDGAMQLNIQELQTIAHGALPIKIVVMNNGCHGMVRQFQDEILQGRHPSTVDGYSAPDFVRIAESYGIPAQRVAEEMRGTRRKPFELPARPAIAPVVKPKGRR